MAGCLQEDYFLCRPNLLTTLLTCQLCVKSVKCFSCYQNEICPHKKKSLIEGNYYRIHRGYFLEVLYGWDSFTVHVLICSSFTTLSGSCERIHISNSRLFKIGMFFNRNTARNHWRENVPLHICLNIPVIMALLVCSFGRWLCRCPVALQ